MITQELLAKWLHGRRLHGAMRGKYRLICGQTMCCGKMWINLDAMEQNVPVLQITCKACLKSIEKEAEKCKLK